MPRLTEQPVHLGRGGAAFVLPEMTGGLEWYRDYAAAHDGDGADGRLVSLFRFDEDWTGWEMHPQGAELVLCVEGSLVLHQQSADGTITRVALVAGDYAINPPGIWHTADIGEGGASALFITPGFGTTHRPR